MTHVIQQFETFVNDLSTEPEPKDRLFMAAGLLELMRRAHNPNTLIGVAQLLVSLPTNVKWSRIPFSVTQTFLGVAAKKRANAIGVPEKNLPEVLLSAFLLFIEFVTADVELTEETVFTCVECAAKDFVEAQKRLPPTRGPELFTENVVPRSFKAKPLSAEALAAVDAKAVYFRGELPGAKLGPDLRGFMFDVGVGERPLHILLETGEYVRLKSNLLTLAQVDDPAEYKDFPASLSLSLQLASLNLLAAGAVNKEQETALAAGLFGKVTGAQHNVTVSTQDLQPLEHVFDIGHSAAEGFMGATGPSGASVRFPVPNTDMAVIIDARQSSAGPYAVSRLVRATNEDSDTVIMRNDTPRLLTTKGVYLFPTKDAGLVSLTAIF